MNPKISIITPVLNMVDHVADCILSVRDQNANVEHIIVDGGSQDGTLDMIERHQHPGLTLISEADSGQSEAINKGLKLSSGEIFNWLNADDRLKPHSLSEVASLMSPSVSIVLGKCEHRNPDAVDIIGRTFHDGSISSTLANYGMAQPSHFYRTEHVKALNGVTTDLHYVMDMDLWFRYLLQFGNEGIVKSDHILSEFWLHADSKSSAQAKAMSKEKYAVFYSVLRELSAPEFLLDVTRGKASDLRIEYQTERLDKTEFMASFSWHLLLEAYEKSDLELAKKLLELVNQGDRLNSTEKAAWNLRVSGSSGQLIKKLRGR